MRTRSGEPQSGRLRVVCASCNNGWMSDLQQEAKPHLLPLIKGETYLLHRNDQKTLAAWIAMFAMVAEHVDKIALAHRPRLRSPSWNAHTYGHRLVWIFAHRTHPVIRSPLKRPVVHRVRRA